MTKLNESKIRWIMRELEKGELSVRKVARLQKVTPRRVRQLRQYKQDTGDVFQLKRERIICRRATTVDEIRTVIEARGRHKVGSTLLEKIIDREYGRHISHNAIQIILEEGGFTVPLRKKIRRRAWVRYERRHSNSMWHADWTQLDDGKWFIAYEDDASRKAVSWGVFDSPTSEYSIQVLKKGIETHGKPREILTGHDAQFYANEQEGKEQGKNAFQLFLEKQDIKHILGRINHPQTNGKEERLFGTVKSKLHEFSSIDDLMYWYNEIKPHMSLDLENLETPAQAFVRKLHYTAKR